MQILGHPLLHFGKALFHQLQHGGLRLRLRLRHMMQASGKAFLPVTKALNPLAKLIDLTGERF